MILRSEGWHRKGGGAVLPPTWGRYETYVHIEEHTHARMRRDGDGHACMYKRALYILCLVFLRIYYIHMHAQQAYL